MTLHTRSSEAMGCRLACAREGCGVLEDRGGRGSVCGQYRISKSCRASSGRWARARWGILQLQLRNRSTPKCHRQAAPVMRALVLSPRAICPARRSCAIALRRRGTHAAEPASFGRHALTHHAVTYQLRRALSHAPRPSSELSRPTTLEPTISALSTAEPTIYALSTASGRAAIAVIRVSGPACKRV